MGELYTSIAISFPSETWYSKGETLFSKVSPSLVRLSENGRRYLRNQQNGKIAPPAALARQNSLTVTEF